jgi:hypothetical protein
MRTSVPQPILPGMHKQLTRHDMPGEIQGKATKKAAITRDVDRERAEAFAGLTL